MPERGQLPSSSSHSSIFHQLHLDTTIRNYIQDQLKDINEEVESLRQATLEQQIQLEETDEEVEGLREMVSEQQDDLEDMNNQIEYLYQSASEQQEQLDAAAATNFVPESRVLLPEISTAYVESEVVHESRVSRGSNQAAENLVLCRLAKLEERLDSIISITATVSHETAILRTTMEQMGKGLEKIVIIAGIVAGMATAAFVYFYLL
jgi:DNA repair exonuclease SbcCD ATPase subunit